MKSSKKIILCLISIIAIVLLGTGYILNMNSKNTNNKNNTSKENNESGKVSYNEALEISKKLEGSEESKINIQDIGQSYVVEFRDKDTNEFKGSYMIDKKDGKAYSIATIESSIGVPLE